VGESGQTKLGDLTDDQVELVADSMKRMKQTIKAVSKTHGINLVIRMDGSRKLGENSRENLLREFLDPVVFHRKLDLTPIVINAMEKQTDETLK